MMHREFEYKNMLNVHELSKRIVVCENVFMFPIIILSRGVG